MKKIIAILSCFFCTQALYAQIPNGGFETWDTVGTYTVPQSWANLNPLTDTLSVYTCQMGSPGNPGASFLKLTSRTFDTTVAPGIAVCGTMDMTTFQPVSGFACSQRPVSLTGTWQHMIFGTTEGYVYALLTRWNSGTSLRDTVALAHQTFAGMVMSWTNFTIPFTYYSGAVPDSAIVYLSASGSVPKNNDYLWVDNLAFTGTVPTGITGISNYCDFSVYPNPSKGVTTVRFDNKTGKDAEIHVSDLMGRKVWSRNVNSHNGINSMDLDLSGLTSGIYCISLFDGYTLETQKITIAE